MGIETSCDETAIGVVEDGRTILSNVVASSLHQHAPYGGVVPEIAARAHVEFLWEVFAQALQEAKLEPEGIDAVAVTYGPGLPGALLIGLAFAKGLALALNRPLIPVDHLAAHLYAGQMHDPSLEPPYIGLVVSGGHTLLAVVHPDCRYEVLGETKDDAVGEAFDKVAKLLGLGYPGGPAIDQISDEASGQKIAFPRSVARQPLDFSFSGLKTAVYEYVKRQTQPAGVLSGRDRSRRQTLGEEHHAHKDPIPDISSPQAQAWLNRQQVADIAAGFQEAAVDILVSKTLKACQRTGLKAVTVGGGVAANRRLRARFGELSAKNYRSIFPPPSLCMDNGAMVAGIAYPLLQQGRLASLTLDVDPNLCLT